MSALRLLGQVALPEPLLAKVIPRSHDGQPK